jgi:hypothetical protein
VREQSIILRRLLARDGLIQRVVRVLSSLPQDEDWEFVIRPYRVKRSNPQNDYMWALYDFIIRRGGVEMEGWTKDDLHEYFLQQHFGSRIITFMGDKKRVPLRRSSKLNKQEFTDYLEFILRFMAERGVYLPSPEDDWQAVLRAA